MREEVEGEVLGGVLIAEAAVSFVVDDLGDDGAEEGVLLGGS